MNMNVSNILEVASGGGMSTRTAAAVGGGAAGGVILLLSLLALCCCWRRHYSKSKHPLRYLKHSYSYSVKLDTNQFHDDDPLVIIMMQRLKAK